MVIKIPSGITNYVQYGKNLEALVVSLNTVGAVSVNRVHEIIGDIRNIKVKTKVSGCFRSSDGAVEYLDIMSYIGTARKHGINSFKAVLLAVCGNPYAFGVGSE